MLAAPCASVSELYSADEVALLLDEIKELEPTSCRGEDVQDFEIAGSGLGGVCGAGGGGGRSPCGTELTERSWDSHAHYSRPPAPRPMRLAPLYCRLRHLVTPAGAASFTLALASFAACVCVWAVCGVRTQRLPLSSRVRVLLYGALTSTLLHGGLVFVHVSRLHLLLPVDWRCVRVLAGGWSALWLLTGGLLTLHSLLLTPEYRHAPPHIARLLKAAAGLGVACAVLGAVMVCLGAPGCWRRHRACLHPPRPPASADTASNRGAYRAVPSAPPPPQPSTSRDDPL